MSEFDLFTGDTGGTNTKSGNRRSSGWFFPLTLLGLVLDLFLSLPPHLGLLSQLRYLTPAQVLINSSMADPRLLRIFGLVLTPLQSARLVYLILTVAAAAGVRSLYRRL